MRRNVRVVGTTTPGQPMQDGTYVCGWCGQVRTWAPSVGNEKPTSCRQCTGTGQPGYESPRRTQ